MGGLERLKHAQLQPPSVARMQNVKITMQVNVLIGIWILFRCFWPKGLDHYFKLLIYQDRFPDCTREYLNKALAYLISLVKNFTNTLRKPFDQTCANRSIILISGKLWKIHSFSHWKRICGQPSGSRPELLGSIKNWLSQFRHALKSQMVSVSVSVNHQFNSFYPHGFSCWTKHNKT